MREYSQRPDEKAALNHLAREVEAARRGAPDAGRVREFVPSELYDPQAAESEAWRQWEAGEVTARQRDTLLRYAGADVHTAPGVSTRASL